MRKLLMVAAGALMIGTLVATPAAAKGSKPSPSRGQCVVTPNPVANGMQYTVAGSGFSPGMQLSVFVGSDTILMAVADASGRFSVWSWAQFLMNGAKTVAIYQAGDRRMTLLGSCSFQVL